MTEEQIKEAEALADRLASGWPALEDLNAAVTTIRSLAARVREQGAAMNPLDIPIEDFANALPMRPRNCIKANMWSPFETTPHLKPPHTVRHLMMFSRKEMRQWPNLGKKSLNEIEESLRELGLQLWEEHDERSLRPLIEYQPSVLEQPQQEPLTARELELLDGLIEYWQHHADVCGSMQNQRMGQKQRGWDLERVALLKKLRFTPVQPQQEAK